VDDGAEQRDDEVGQENTGDTVGAAAADDDDDDEDDEDMLVLTVNEFGDDDDDDDDDYTAYGLSRPQSDVLMQMPQNFLE